MQKAGKMKKIFFILFLIFVFQMDLKLGNCAEEVVLDGQNVFPLIHLYSLYKNGYKEGLLLSKPISLGFCTAQLTIKDGEGLISGKSLDGRKWDIDFVAETSLGGCDLYLGDLDQNGNSDVIITYSLNSYGIGPNLYCLTIFLDKVGYPHPTIFGIYVDSFNRSFKNLIRDSQGKAVLIHKFLWPPGAACCYCNASIYRANNSKWEKLDSTNIELKNQNYASSFTLKKEKHFGDEDQALIFCSAKENPDAPDLSNLQIKKFKNIISDPKIEYYDFKFQGIDENDKKVKWTADASCGDCFFVLESKSEFKMIDACFIEDAVLKQFKEKKWPLWIIQSKNSGENFFWFCEPGLTPSILK